MSLQEEQIQNKLLHVLGEEEYEKLNEETKQRLGSYIISISEQEEEKVTFTSSIKESISEMLAFAHEGKPVEFSAAFSDAMKSIILDKIDQLRPGVAARLFSKE